MWVRSKGTDKSNTLLLTARQHMRIAIRHMGERHQFEKLGCSCVRFVAGYSSQAEQDIFFDRQMRKQGVVLKDHTNVPLFRLNKTDGPTSVLPPIVSVPLSGASIPAMMRNREVLPQPE